MPQRGMSVVGGAAFLPPTGKNVGAGPRPERVRRDESRLYVVDFPCGRGEMPMQGLAPHCGRQECRPS